MRVHRCVRVGSVALAFSIVILVCNEAAQAQSKNSKYACSEPDPASICSAGNTCGSPSQPCSVDVKKSGDGATATPGIAGAKGNSTFCVKVGTSVTWKSETKHQGF